MELMRFQREIANGYEVQRKLFTNVVREYILENLNSTYSINTHS
jgi:hypothetical protein